MSGEAASVTEDMTADWLATNLPALLSEFEPEKISMLMKRAYFGNACQTRHLTSRENAAVVVKE